MLEKHVSLRQREGVAYVVCSTTPFSNLCMNLRGWSLEATVSERVVGCVRRWTARCNCTTDSRLQKGRGDTAEDQKMTRRDVLQGSGRDCV
jgi:hypothetical protein